MSGLRFEKRNKGEEGEASGERHRLPAEHYRVRALIAWQRVARNTFSDTHRYHGHAIALREQAARTRFPEIRAQFLAIAEKYESMASFIEQAMRTRPWWAASTRRGQRRRADRAR